MKHGILCKTGLFIKNANQIDFIQMLPELTLSCLCEQTFILGLTHLWVTKDTGIVPDKSFVDAAREQWSLLATYRYPEAVKLSSGKPNEAVYVTASQKNTLDERRQITIVFPYNTKWNFGTVNNPRHLLGTIAYLEKSLQVKIVGSPAKVGWKLIELLNAEQWDTLSLKPTDLATYHFDQHAAQDIIWQRPLHAYEIQKYYLHKYRNHTAYLYECLQQDFGIGEPLHVSGTNYDPCYPGVWRISVKEKMLHNLPAVLWEGAEWVAAPIVKFLHEIGEDVTVHEGWVYPQVNDQAHYQPWLKPWAQFIWQKWQDFKDDVRWRNYVCREYAQWSMKDIVMATVATGTAHHSQPGVRIQAVGGARATMLGHILEVQREQLLKPVLVYKDALYYLSNQPEPQGILASMVAQADVPGRFSWEWALPMTKHVGEILMQDIPALEKQRMLQRIVQKRENEDPS
ncbi:hypothetical protein KDW_46920 [Dictyobacter vulcani]|uniref:Uncharacterized protein n=1 Tax=Dictyobacter vulcani TaxID=2607529 RepID=A0A5J4KVI4_9CHLR|nr:hypothetical protein [Dictyobacter vulcani]GER90530.1 hypothetical protein KDW_46920 [Dictyobacter vulcani]